MSLIIGDAAPDFELPNQFGQNVTLSEFKGKSQLSWFSTLCHFQASAKANFAKLGTILPVLRTKTLN